MNIEAKLNRLSNINQVDAPSFMFTRIQQRIKEQDNEKVSINFKWIYAFSAIIIIVLNIATFNLNKTNSESNLESIATEMQLKNNNNFYNK